MFRDVSSRVRINAFGSGQEVLGLSGTQEMNNDYLIAVQIL